MKREVFCSGGGVLATCKQRFTGKKKPILGLFPERLNASSSRHDHNLTADYSYLHPTPSLSSHSLSQVAFITISHSISTVNGCFPVLLRELGDTQRQGDSFPAIISALVVTTQRYERPILSIMLLAEIMHEIGQFLRFLERDSVIQRGSDASRCIVSCQVHHSQCFRLLQKPLFQRTVALSH